MTDEILQRLLKETPQEILDTTFDPVDLENLHSIKHELGICMKWGMITKDVFDDLMVRVDSLVFLENECPHTQEGFVKRNPYDALFRPDKARINGPEDKAKMARDYVLLNLLKKLLGALKTHVNKELEKFDVVDEDTAGDLREMVDHGRQLDLEPDEEEMDLVSPMDTEPGEIRALVSHGDCSHRRTTVKQIPASKTASRMDELHTFCKDCKSAIDIQITKVRTSGIGHRARFKEPLPCRHRSAVWKEGEEGKVALCSDCKEVHPSPQTMLWEKVGLEPFGDDPEKDEIQTFNTPQIHAVVGKGCEHTTANFSYDADEVEIAHCADCGVEVDGSLYNFDVPEETEKEATA